MSDRAAELRALSDLLTEPLRTRVRLALLGFERGAFFPDPFVETLRRRPELARLVVLAATLAAEWRMGGAVEVRMVDRASVVVRAWPGDVTAGVALAWRRFYSSGLGVYVARDAAARASRDLDEAVQVFATTLREFSGANVRVNEATGT